MGNKHEKRQNKKCRRRIRIRLADPNIPDSYVCEIFDSSLENEDEPCDESLLKPKEDYSKPKNYFEILMSNESRKSVKGNGAKENEDISHEVKNEKLVSERKSKKVLNQLGKPSRENNKEDKTDSSDDESLFQIQRKFQSEKVDSDGDLAEVKVNNVDIEEEELLTIFDSPKLDFSKKKTLSILNYFSPEEISNSNKFHKAKCKKLKAINVKNSLKATNKNLAQLGQSHYKNSVNGINKENVKLAPLFQKKEKKVIDPATQKARLDFLFKGSQLVIKKPETNKTPDNICNFPKISHIQQRDESAYWSVRDICVPNGRHLEEYVFESDKKFNIDISKISVVDDTIVNDAVNFNNKFLCEIKCKYSDLNLDSVIDGLKEKRDKFAIRDKELGKSTNLKSEIDESGFDVLNALWTDKYKPKSSEILSNGNAVKKLKKWLQCWKTFDEELKALVKSGGKLKSQRDSDDSDDFLGSDDDDFGLKAPGNVCLLSGPNGCGKTALIFALANELEFSVLEVNASSKRTGKKVLSDLHEATQSHKVRVHLTQIETEKKKKKTKRRKKSKKTGPPAKVLDQTADCKISLILIEDADIVFEEHDEGFVSAIASLVQTSKRPLIFLTNDSNCPYLDNFKTEQCLILEMERPNFYKSCAVLDVVSSLEGASLDRELLESLLRQNNFDLRKSLLELQFWVQPGLNSFRLYRGFDLGSLWWGLSKFLYRKNFVHFVRPQSRKRKRMNDFFDSSDEEDMPKKLKLEEDESKDFLSLKPEEVVNKWDPMIHSCFSVLDMMSTLDYIRLCDSDEPIPGFDYKPKDSLSLEENMEESSWVRKNLTEELTGELVKLSTRIFARKCMEKEIEERKLSFVSPSWEEIRWRTSQEKASAELSVLVPLHNGRDNKSLNLDYLPALRSICRVGRNQLVVNPKRKNRFYHYLNNLGVELTEENVEINCDIFGS